MTSGAFKHRRCVSLLIFTLLSSSVAISPREKKKVVNYDPVFMSSEQVMDYFKTFYTSKTSTFDKVNEEFYHQESFARELYHKIDNLMPSPVYVKWLMKTKDITDKIDGNKYEAKLNAKCSPVSVFNSTLQHILQKWDGDRTIISNELEQWHADNKRTPFHEICNRFRGLTCQYKRAIDPELDQGKSVEMTNYTTCQCSGDSSTVGFYKTTSTRKENSSSNSAYSSNSYPDGCYIRPWKPCKFLSVDTTFKHHYYNQWHGSLENDRQVLAQMVFPVARTHRCKEGTYCLDIVPGMNKPVCWCNPHSEDKLCKQAFSSKKVPSASELSKIRKAFLKLLIPANVSNSFCNPEHNDEILKLMADAGRDPTRTGVVNIMSQLVSGNPIKICDFREALLCDKVSLTCKGNLNCDPGKIHVGKGVCAINNGFKCQSNEECVENAKCKYFKEASDSACVCEKGYGNQCNLQNAAFFAKRFLPIVSGFQGDEFIKLQVEVNHVLEAWEDLMKRKHAESCEPSFDSTSLAVVNYFGSLQVYDKHKGSGLLDKIRKVIVEGNKLCQYKYFLKCDSGSRKCVPIHGKKIISSSTDASDNIKILVEVEPQSECNPDLVNVFEGLVKFTCSRGFTCRKLQTAEKCVPDCASVYAPRKLCPALPTTVTPFPNMEIQTETEVDMSVFSQNSQITSENSEPELIPAEQN